MRTIAIALFFVLGLAGWIAGQTDNPNGGAKRPLDLPSGGNGDDDEEEDEPESITYYGAEYEGDAFFWCLDKSCSMGWQGEIYTLKSETSSAVQQLSSRAEFAMVAFNTTYDVWPQSEMPVKASTINKTSANAWIQSLQPDGVTCVAAAAVKTLQVAHQSSRHKRVMIMLGDGQPVCPGGSVTDGDVLGDIAAANYEGITINTLYISASPEGMDLFQAIAAQNNGTFTVVD
ncbi:MAG: vWA domain-containing protein [Planctomycetota bacterium]